MRTNAAIKLALSILSFLFCIDGVCAPLVGIGVALGTDRDRIVIRQVMPDSPAALAGQLHVGDELVAVAQTDAEPKNVKGMAIEEIVKLIRGEKGTAVQLTVIPAGLPNPQTKTVRLIRTELKGTRAPTIGTRAKIGQPVPDIAGEDVDGRSFRLSDYRGKVILLDFWGDW